MPAITEEELHLLAEIQALSRIMRHATNVHAVEFEAAQTKLAKALNRLASLPTVRNRDRPTAGTSGIEV